MLFLVLSGLRNVVSRDSENRSYYHRFANMIRYSEKMSNLFSRKFAKILKTDVILAKFTFFVNIFLRKMSKKVLFRNISTNFSKNHEKCQTFFHFFCSLRAFIAQLMAIIREIRFFVNVFLQKRFQKKYDTNSEAFCSEYLGPNGPRERGMLLVL